MRINDKFDLDSLTELFRQITIPQCGNYRMTLWKIKDFSATQILREFKLCDFRGLKDCHFNRFCSSEYRNFVNF